MYKDNITLFIRYSNELGDTWFPHVLSNVDLNCDRARITKVYGADSADNAVLHVNYVKENEKITVCGKEYLLPKEWAAQTNDRLSETLTFSPDCFIWAGEWKETGPILDEDSRWGRNGFYNHMNIKYDKIFAVTSVAMYSVIPHFEIMCK